MSRKAVFLLLLVSNSTPVLANEKPDYRQDKPTVIVRLPSKADQQVPWSSELTLLSAIRAAGGFIWTPPKEVRILRGKEILRFRPKSIIKAPATDPVLIAGDIVEVPK